MVFGTNINKLEICITLQLLIEGEQIRRVDTTSFLGITVDEILHWGEHNIHKLCKNISRGL